MNLPTLLVLAQRDRWERLGDQFSGENARLDLSELGWLAAVAVGAVLALWWLSSLAKRLEGRSARPAPKRLFRELCQAHKLSSQERRLLKQIATQAGEEHPAMLFVREDLFASHPLPGQQTAVQTLREKLFAA